VAFYTFGFEVFHCAIVTMAQKERLVILGSGWGGYEVLRHVDKERWGASFCSLVVIFRSIRSRFCLVDVTVLSPRSYFTFTPLLPSCSVGTLEFRCVMESVSAVQLLFWADASLGPTVCSPSGMVASHDKFLGLTVPQFTRLATRHGVIKSVSYPNSNLR
jgi:hypothetical protein